MHTTFTARCLTLASASLIVLAAPQLAAQSLRGVVIDAAAHPVPGVVVQLLDSVNAQVARSLTNETGEYRLAASRPGTYQLRASRIGYRPTISAGLVLAAGEARTERLTLNGVQLALDTVRVVASNSCRASTDAGSATFAVLEQARTALQATELTSGARAITATTLDYESALDATGRRTLRQDMHLRAQTVRQPWSAAAPSTLHATGYVLKEASDTTTYFAPGLDMLTSDLFLGDHCFELRRDGGRLGIAFEPTPERRNTAEIRGTMWLDLATSRLQRLEYSYVNLPSELDASAGGALDFARLSNGGWVVSRWRIRMPIIERRFRTQALGGNSMHVSELREEGGELVTAVRDRDTLWAQPARVLKGIVSDSASGRGLPNARLTVTGTGRSATTDDRGRFEVGGLLLGDYAIEVRTASLDSIGGRHEALVEFHADATEANIRVPNSAQFMSDICGGSGRSVKAGLFGRVKVLGAGGVPGDARLVVEWLDPVLHGSTDAVIVSRERQTQTTRPDSTGSFRLCGLPTATDLAVRVTTDSAVTTPLRIRLSEADRFARLEIPIDRTISMYASMSGVVRRDSGQTVAGADVSIDELSKGVTTDSNGVFRIRNIEPGTYRVVVRKLGLSAFDTVITFTRNVDVKRTITLTKVQNLAAVVTRSKFLPPSFEDHYRLGMGAFLTREQLEKQEGRMLGTVMSEMRGARVVNGPGRYAWMSSSRRQDCMRGMICGEDTVGADMSRGIIARCYSAVYVDNVLMNRGKRGATEPFNLNDIPVENIEALEYFASRAETPAEYAGPNSKCGVLVIHTRKSR